MLRSSLHPLLPVVALAGAGLIVACGGEGDPTPQVNAGGSASGATSSGGSSKAGSSSGQPPSGGGGGKAGAPGSSGKSGEGNDGSNGGSDAGQGDAGSSSPGGSGGPVGHGGAPNVDYGSPEVPPAAWTNITGTFAGMESECGNMSRLFSNPRADQLVLGVARQGLWASVDGGVTFARLGAGGGDMILNRLSTVAWDPSSSNVFYVSGIYGFESPFTDSVLKTENGGLAFRGNKALSAIQSHNDSVSVDFDDPAQKTMLAGGHEQADVLFRTTDAGATWTNIRDKLPETLGFCTWTLVLDAKRFLVGCAASYSGKAGAIMRSADGGDTWSQVSDKGVNNQPLWAYDGSIYWTNEAGGVLKSDDLGLTFKPVSTDSSSRIAPIQLPDGRIVSLANRTLTASADGGKTWQTIGAALPFDPYGLDYSPFRRAFYATQFDCNAVVPADAIERFGYDFMP